MFKRSTNEHNTSKKKTRAKRRKQHQQILSDFGKNSIYHNLNALSLDHNKHI